MLSRAAARLARRVSRASRSNVTWSGKAAYTTSRGAVAAARPFAARTRTSNVASMGVRFMSTEEGRDASEKDAAGEAAAAAEKGEEEAPGPQVYSGETVAGEQEAHDFKAETRQLLDIVANSLYQDKEVFIRELISNSSDALEKARYLSLTQGGEQLAENLEVKVVLDEKEGIFMIQDNGVGMTGSDLKENLGTIARSGSKEFMKSIQAEGGGGSGTDAEKNIIGKFGVGFYSAFMVADEVKVFSKKRGDDQGHCWTMNTSEASYKIAKADGVEPGTKIVIKLREDCKDFAQIRKVREIVMRFSTFVSFPLTVNGSQVNDVKALWLGDASAVTEEEHSALFKHLAGTWEDPMYTLMYKADAPIDIKSVFYVPRRNEESFGQGVRNPGVHLYSRRVLIQKNAKDLLPDYLRFVKGVVDSEDLPLSISRETMQDKKLLSKLKQVLSKRVIRWMNDEAKKDEEKYRGFYEQFVMYLKEGVATDQANSKDLMKLLRYSTSAQEDDKLTSLKEYVDRMKPDQEAIYYLVTSDRKAALASPYYEAFKRAGVEVIFCYALHDEIVMGNADAFEGKSLKSIEVAEPPEMEEDKEEEGEKKDGEEGETKKDGDDAKPESGKKKLTNAEAEELITWLKVTLMGDVTNVEKTNRLVDSPAIIGDHDSAVTRRMMQMEEFKALGIHQPSGHKLMINPSHPLIIELHRVRFQHPGVAKIVAEQILDNAKISAGIVDHVQSMMPRLSAILKSALSDDSVPAPTLEDDAAGGAAATGSEGEPAEGSKA